MHFFTLLLIHYLCYFYWVYVVRYGRHETMIENCMQKYPRNINYIWYMHGIEIYLLYWWWDIEPINENLMCRIASATNNRRPSHCPITTQQAHKPAAGRGRVLAIGKGLRSSQQRCPHAGDVKRNLYHISDYSSSASLICHHGFRY